MHDTLALRGSVIYDQLGEAEIEEVKKEVELFLDGAIPEIEVNWGKLKTVYLMGCVVELVGMWYFNLCKHEYTTIIVLRDNFLLN